MLLTLKFFPGIFNIGNDMGDISHDNGKEQKRKYELKDTEYIIGLATWMRKLANHSHDLRDVVEDLQVLEKWITIWNRTKGVGAGIDGQANVVMATAVAYVHKVFREATGYDEGEAGVVVEYGEHVVEHAESAEHIGVVGVTLGAVDPLLELVDFCQAKDPENGVVPNAYVEDLQRQKAQQVHVEAGCVHVVVSEAQWVRLKNALLVETGFEAQVDVEQVKKVACVVTHPISPVIGSDFVERVAVDNYPKVVQKGK